MNSYYRVMLGNKSAHAQGCFAGEFVGADFRVAQHLSSDGLT